MSERVEDLASQVDDAIEAVEELEGDPGDIKKKKIDKVKGALDNAKKTVDEMEDAQD